MTRLDCTRVSKLPFKQIERELARISPELARAAANLPGDAPSLFKASYDYGELIVDHGRFCPPQCGDSACQTCRQLVEEASYSCIPLSAVLSKSVEVFVDPLHSGGWDPENPRHVPLRMLSAGELFGVFEALDRFTGTPAINPVWSISAGARSVWIVAPIGDERITQWLRNKWGVRWTDGANQHWELVKKLHGAKWQCEVLVFPESLMASLKEGKEFYALLLEVGWKYSASLRNASSAEAAIRANFTSSFTKTPQGELQHFATVRHLLDVASGSAAAFQPASNSKIDAGPFGDVCDTIRDCLKIAKKNYHPLILQPAHLENSGEIGYYSFRCPSVPGPRPQRVANYAEIPGTISDALDVFRNHPHVALDYERTTFFARVGQFAAGSNLPIDDLVPDPSAKVYLNSPFFVAGARIVRAESERFSSRAATL